VLRPVGFALSSALLTLAAVGAGAAAPAGTQVFHGVDRGLCPFPLEITVRTSPSDQAATTVLQYTFAGSNTITLRNQATGKSVILRSTGPYVVDTKTGSVSFSGHQVWFWSTGNRVPFMTTDGRGSFKSPTFVLTGSARAAALDPCALVSPRPPSTRPAASKGPWGLPAYALSHIRSAGLVPILATLVRHDHTHVDLIVNGRHVTIPAGVGMAEPYDTGPCPKGPVTVGDCTTGHIYVAKVAVSPIHTHSTSGIIHIESDRKGGFTLGQFFDEWGVRLTSRCVGGYCTRAGRQLRVYVNGKRVANPRAVPLLNRQEIAVVYGGPGAFRDVPASYRGGWPGLGCGGRGEVSCLPPTP
jgi:hypothetical protein